MRNPFVENLVKEVTAALRFYATAHATSEEQAEEIFVRYRQLFVNEFIDSMHREEYKTNED